MEHVSVETSTNLVETKNGRKSKKKNPPVKLRKKNQLLLMTGRGLAETLIKAYKVILLLQQMWVCIFYHLSVT